MKTQSHLAAALLTGLLLSAPVVCQAAEIRVLSTNAVTEVMHELVPAFEKATGHKVVAEFQPTSVMATRIKGGERSDVVILIKGALGELTQAGKVKAEGQADIAKTSLGIAVRAGSPKPDISTLEAFKQAMLNAKSVARSEAGASGVQFGRVLEQLGIADAMKPKIKMVAGATPTATLVASGEAEIAVQMISELLPVAGVEIVGSLPGNLHYEIVVASAVSADAKEPAAAAELVRFLAAPAAAPVLKKKGMEGV